MRYRPVRFLPPFLLALAFLALGCQCNDVPDAPDICEPVTCQEAGKNCGVIDDGCGGTTQCGYCGGGMVCGAATITNVCAGGDCRPVSCNRLGAECGSPSNGCGGALSCGFCDAATQCGGAGESYTCGVSACTPLTCESAGATCGRLPDGCGGVLDCSGPGEGDGGCAEGETCGGGGVANACGTGSCTPSNCSATSCSYASDGCGDVVACGSCDSGLVCLGSRCADVADGVGDGCTTHSDCATDYCLTELSSGWPGGYCTTSCTTDSDCGTGNLCGLKDGSGQGVCVSGCLTGEDCRSDGYVCGDVGAQTAGCIPGGTGTGDTGDACDSVADCAGGTRGVCLGPSEGHPDGYCTQTCTVDADCAGDSQCAFGTGGRGVCVAACTDDGDCREEHRCTELDGGVEGCWPGGSTGSACTEAEDCSGGICLTQSDTGWHGGYCTSSCTTSSDCGDGEICASEGPSGENICMQGCDDGRDCRGDGYACVTVDGGSVCAPYGSGDGQPGDPCQSVADCAGGTGATCVQGPDGGTCAEACSTDDDCPDGRCTSDGQRSVCSQTCFDENDCPDGFECEPYDGGDAICQPGDDPDPEGSPSGGECEGSGDCDSGLCISELNTGWLGGYCTRLCASDADCEPEAHCAEIFESDLEDPILSCVASCTGDGQCREGYGCYDRDGDGRTECLPFGAGDRVGDPCSTIDECPGGADATCNLTAWGFPDGYCAMDCSSTPCVGDSHCSHFENESVCLDPICCNQPATCDTTGWEEDEWEDPCDGDTACETATFSDAYGHCVLPLRTCSATILCPQGYYCSNDSNGRCIRCDGDQQCREEYVCFDANSDGTRTCWPAATGDGAPGAACTGLSDCSGGAYGACLTEENDHFPGGYCVWHCGDGINCPSGSTCANLRIVTEDGQVLDERDMCLKTCSSNDDCRSGYDCGVVDPGSPAVCFPSDDD